MQCLTGRSWLVWIKEDHHQICTLGEPADDSGKVEAPAVFFFGLIDHPGTIDECHSAKQLGWLQLQTDMRDQLVAEVPQTLIWQVRIADDRGTVTIGFVGAICDDRKVVVGWCHACLLDLYTKQVINEGRLAG